MSGRASSRTSVNDPGGLWCFSSIPKRPLPNLVRACREEASQVHHLSHGGDDLWQSRFGSEFLTLFFCLGLGFKSRQSLLERNR